MFFLLSLYPCLPVPVVHRNVGPASFALLVTTLEMNNYLVNGKDEISWKLKNTMKKQCDSDFIVVRQCTMLVLRQRPCVVWD